MSQTESAGDFMGFTRIEPGMSQELLLRVVPHLTKGRLRGCRTPLEPRPRPIWPQVTVIVAFSSVPHNTISGFVPEVAQAIIYEYVSETMQT